MVLNREPHLRPLSIHRDINTIEDHRSTSLPSCMELLSAGAPISGPPTTPVLRNLQVSPHTTEPTRPKAKESPAEDVRPKKKQRALSTTTATTTAPTSPTLPVIRDIPPERFFDLPIRTQLTISELTSATHDASSEKSPAAAGRVCETSE